MNNYKPLFEDRTEEELNQSVTNMNIFGKRNLDDYRMQTETKLSQEETTNKILDFIKNNSISSHEMKVFNKILGDNEILDKLIFIWDGSYRTQRIFYKKFSENSEGLTIESDWLYHNNEDNYYNLSDIEKLDFLKNNYESIFIHLVSDESAMFDRIFDDYYDDMPDYDDLYEGCN